MLTYGEESELCLINPIIGRCRQQTSVSAGSQTLLNLKSIRPLFCGDSIITSNDKPDFDHGADFGYAAEVNGLLS